MGKNLKKSYILIPMILSLLAVFVYSAISVTNTYATSSSWSGITTSSANVRTGTNTRASVVATYGSKTHITVYQTVAGQVIWSRISAWYRVSPLGSAPRYIYGGLVNRVNGGGNKVSAPPPTTQRNYSITISLSKQSLSAYLNGRQVYASPVTTGMPGLETPTGTWHVYRKLTNIQFISPWAKGSPYYYAPEHVNYALDYSGMLFMHDATWRSAFGPGTQYPHKDPKFGNMTGSHGCINLPLNAAAWLYNWAPLGTTVTVQR